MTQVVEFFEIVLPRCANTYGTAPCAARLSTNDDPVAVLFDGSTTYLKRGGGLTGAADSKSITISCWIKMDDPLVGGYLFEASTALNGTAARTGGGITAGAGTVILQGYNAAGTLILDQRSSAPVATGRRVHVLVSVDLTNTTHRHVYVDDVSDLTGAIAFTNDTIDFTMADWGIGATPGGTVKFAGSVADLWVAPGVYLDLSVEANRRKFISSTGGAVSLGASGETPTGTAPLIFMSGDISAWHTNKGTGGGFTEVGELAEADFATGSVKCFKCLATCQDTNNFVDTTATLRFAKPADYLPRDIDIVGSWIKSIEHTSATISFAENLGTRAVLKVALEDHPHSDAGEGLDDYLAERGYNTYERGSFWPRFVARYPSLDGVACAWVLGEVGQTIEEMERRWFFIEGAPSGDGAVTITAKDVIKFLDSSKIQIPPLSEGFLTAGIDADDLTFTISPSGAGAAYPTPGYINIGGKECCSYTRSGDVFTIVRQALGTTAASHSSGDRVQWVKRYASQAAADILADAIGYSEMPASYIALAEWQLEDATNLGTLYTFNLVEPVGVGAFASRVLEQSGSMMWDDEVAQKLRFRVIKSVSPAADIVSEANVIGKTFELIAQPEARVSRTNVYYGPADPTKKRDDLANYRQTVIRPDEATALLSERLYGSPSMRTILADGIAVGGGSVAERVGNLVVGRKQRPPRRFKWTMFREEPNLPEKGGGYYLSWRSLQDASGARELVPVQIISARVSATTVQYIAEEMRFTDLDTESSTDRVLLINFGTFNINLRAIHDLTYPSTFGSGVTVTFIMSSAIGSVSTALPAVTLGSWPVGFVPTIIMTGGHIQGMGGLGGLGGAYNGVAGAGFPGGTALYLRHPINLEFPSGAKIWSGGGGGGGGAGGPSTTGAGGGGGGGGAGQNPGVGGLGGNGYFAGTAGLQGATGTSTAGGAGGAYGTATAGIGGYGGGPGLAGLTGNGSSSGATGNIGGAAGAAIDGWSYVTVTVSGGDLRGGQIN